jgi:hypothetical protein
VSAAGRRLDWRQIDRASKRGKGRVPPVQPTPKAWRVSEERHITWPPMFACRSRSSSRDGDALPSDRTGTGLGAQFAAGLRDGAVMPQHRFWCGFLSRDTATIGSSAAGAASLFLNDLLAFENPSNFLERS